MFGSIYFGQAYFGQAFIPIYPELSAASLTVADVLLGAPAVTTETITGPDVRVLDLVP